MIRPAIMSDLDRVVDIMEVSKKILQAQGNFQWDDAYPLREDYRLDIENAELYVIEDDGVVAGFLCLNSDEPEVYKSAAWKNPPPALVIHRMAVAPELRGKGLAGKLLDFAWDVTRERGFASLRTDTFSANDAMNSLFIKHGFHKTGEIELPGRRQQPFYCYEK